MNDNWGREIRQCMNVQYSSDDYFHMQFVMRGARNDITFCHERVSNIYHSLLPNNRGNIPRRIEDGLRPFHHKYERKIGSNHVAPAESLFNDAATIEHMENPEYWCFWVYDRNDDIPCFDEAAEWYHNQNIEPKPKLIAKMFCSPKCELLINRVWKRMRHIIVCMNEITRNDVENDGDLLPLSRDVTWINDY